MMPVRRLRQIELRELRMFELGDEHRRHAVQRRCSAPPPPSATWSADRSPRPDTPSPRHAWCRPDCPAPCRSSDTAAPGCTAGPARRQLHRLADEEAVVEDAVMRQRRPLRRAGRAGGELDVDRRRRTAASAASSASRARCDAAAMPHTLSNGIMPGAVGPPIWITISSDGSCAASSWPGSARAQLRRQRVDHPDIVARS